MTVVASGTGTLKTTLNSNLNVLYGASLQVSNANLVSNGNSKVTVDGSIAQVGTGAQVTVASNAVFQAQNATSLSMTGGASTTVSNNAKVVVTGSSTFTMNTGATLTAQLSSALEIDSTSIANIDTASQIVVKDNSNFTIQNSK